MAQIQALTDRRALGAWGERLAGRYLTDLGLDVIDRNWRCRHGEIDLVARDGDCLVFCEVKTRTTESFGHAIEAVTWRKYVRLRRLAGVWLEGHDVPFGELRIDVVGILRRPNQPPLIRHERGVA